MSASWEVAPIAQLCTRHGSCCHASLGVQSEDLFVVKQFCASSLAAWLALLAGPGRLAVVWGVVREWLIREWPQLGARQHPAER
jgi:hypothetical protein